MPTQPPHTFTALTPPTRRCAPTAQPPPRTPRAHATQPPRQPTLPHPAPRTAHPPCRLVRPARVPAPTPRRRLDHHGRIAAVVRVACCAAASLRGACCRRARLPTAAVGTSPGRVDGGAPGHEDR